MASKTRRLDGRALIKLSPADVEKILKDKTSTNAVLAMKYQVSISRIWEIRHGIHIKTLAAPTRRHTKR